MKEWSEATSTSLGTLAHFRHFELVQYSENSPFQGQINAWSFGPGFFTSCILQVDEDLKA